MWPKRTRSRFSTEFSKDCQAHISTATTGLRPYLPCPLPSTSSSAFRASLQLSICAFPSIWQRVYFVGGKRSQGKCWCASWNRWSLGKVARNGNSRGTSSAISFSTCTKASSIDRAMSLVPYTVRVSHRTSIWTRAYQSLPARGSSTPSVTTTSPRQKDRS
jgi:hypothetical protein